MFGLISSKCEPLHNMWVTLAIHFSPETNGSV